MTISDKPLVQLPAEVEQPSPIDHRELAGEMIEKRLKQKGELVSEVLKHGPGSMEELAGSEGGRATSKGAQDSEREAPRTSKQA